MTTNKGLILFIVTLSFYGSRTKYALSKYRPQL